MISRTLLLKRHVSTEGETVAEREALPMKCFVIEGELAVGGAVGLQCHLVVRHQMVREVLRLRAHRSRIKARTRQERRDIYCAF